MKKRKLRPSVKIFAFILLFAVLFFVVKKVKGRNGDAGENGSLSGTVENSEHGVGTHAYEEKKPETTSAARDPHEGMISDTVPSEYANIAPEKIKDKYKPNPDSEGLELIDQSKLGDTSKITYMKGRTESGAVVEIINGTTFVNGILMVNKTYRLPAGYVPESSRINLEGVDEEEEGITDEAWDAWQDMLTAADEAGMILYISSGYRSYEFQKEIFDEYTVMEGSTDLVDIYSARPGHSEHQSGLCFDLNSIDDNFTHTAEGKWVDENCWRYGFCIRFPYGKDEYTGYKYESWHLRYVGTELAEKLYNGGEWISLEELFGLKSEYNYEYAKS